MLKQNENVSLSMNYAEYITAVKTEGALLTKKLIAIVAFLALFAAGTWAMCGGIVNMPPCELLVIGVCGIGYFIVSSNLNVEYEYIVASAQVEFDAVYSHKKRKEILTVSLDNVERIAPANKENMSYITSKSFAKTYDFCSSKKSKRRYFMIVKKGTENTLIYFDAIAKTLDVLKFFRSNIVEIDKEIYDM